MVDHIKKALRKVPAQEQRSIKAILKQIRSGQIWDLDIQKLKGGKEIYRVRKGQWRIICLLKDDGTVKILHLGRRSDTTYNQW